MTTATPFSFFLSLSFKKKKLCGEDVCECGGQRTSRGSQFPWGLNSGCWLGGKHFCPLSHLAGPLYIYILKQGLTKLPTFRLALLHAPADL